MIALCMTFLAKMHWDKMSCRSFASFSSRGRTRAELQPRISEIVQMCHPHPGTGHILVLQCRIPPEGNLRTDGHITRKCNCQAAPNASWLPLPHDLTADGKGLAVSSRALWEGQPRSIGSNQSIAFSCDVFVCSKIAFWRKSALQSRQARRALPGSRRWRLRSLCGYR